VFSFEGRRKKEEGRRRRRRKKEEGRRKKEEGRRKFDVVVGAKHSGDKLLLKIQVFVPECFALPLKTRHTFSPLASSFLAAKSKGKGKF
jgi:hypothetical protein